MSLLSDTRALQPPCLLFSFSNVTPTTEIYTLSLHDALPILRRGLWLWAIIAGALIIALPAIGQRAALERADRTVELVADLRSEEHTSELQSRPHLVCRLLLEKKKTI